MRAFEQQPGESSKAFAAYKSYRDLGAGRTLKMAAAAFYGAEEATESQHTQMRRWSARFDWRARVQAYEDYLEMHRLSAIEEHEASRAGELAQRHLALREKLLENAELFAEQANKMLQWPLSDQRMVRGEGENEGDTYIFLPAKWGKDTAARYQATVANFLGAEQEPEDVGEYDFSDLSDEELQMYLEIVEKMPVKPSERKG